MTPAEQINYIANTRWQNARFHWVPLDVNLGAKAPWIALALPGERYLCYNLESDKEERAAWSLGRLTLTRPETDEEYEERLEGEAEEAFMEREANRYTEWHY